MFCLAGLGGHVESFITNTNAAGKIVIIDGCPVDCAKKTLEHTGFADFVHVRVTDLECEKGKSPAVDDTVGRIATEINTMLLS